MTISTAERTRLVFVAFHHACEDELGKIIWPNDSVEHEDDGCEDEFRHRLQGTTDRLALCFGRIVQVLFVDDHASNLNKEMTELLRENGKELLQGRARTWYDHGPPFDFRIDRD